MSEEQFDFPTRPKSCFPSSEGLQDFYWFPIYMEPVCGSGERICCGAVALSQWEARAVLLPGLRRFTRLYRNGGGQFLFSCAKDVVELVEEDLKRQELRDFIVNEKRLPTQEDKIAPICPMFEGFYFGEARWGRGKNLGEVLAMGFMMCGSLYKPEDLENLRNGGSKDGKIDRN